MKEIKFDKTKYVQRLRRLIKREQVKIASLIETTAYKRSTFYRHLNLAVDDVPGVAELIKLSIALNTSLDYLATGSGAEKIAHLQFDEFQKTMKKLYSEELEAYGILINILMKLEYKQVETLVDVALAYGSQTDLF